MTEGITRLASAPLAAPKPLLRGYSHALAAVGALVGVAHLLQVAHGDPLTQGALAVYGGSVVAVFATSALYHIGPWPPRKRAMLRRLDYANICGFIAGAYTPVATTFLAGWWRVGLLAGVWALALAGGVVVTARPTLPRRVRASLYVALAGLAVVASPTILAQLSPAGFLLLGISSVLGVMGAVIYAVQRPMLWPRVFGYHELFHLVVIVANATYYLFVLTQVVPLTHP